MPATKFDRPHRIAARLSDDELAILTGEMARTGLDMSDVLRQALRAYRAANEQASPRARTGGKRR